MSLTPMTEEQKYVTTLACSFGGSFVRTIGEALSRADSHNFAAVVKALGPHGTGALCPYLPGGWRHEEVAATRKATLEN